MRFFVSAMLGSLIVCGTIYADSDWKSLVPGIELRMLKANTKASVGDSRITVVKIDPRSWELEVVGCSKTSESTGKTARDWSTAHNFVIAINAGMFAVDYTTHTGYMESRGHVNNSKTSDYQSVAAFDPRNSTESAHFHIFDLDAPGISIDSIRKDYASLIQNLRLIKRPGVNRWSKQTKKWSEAALGEDKDGHVLFIFSRSPYSMHDFNQELLQADIGVVAAQHLEGGPEAQLYVNIGGVELEMIGSYETSFREDDENSVALRIPNVLGVKKR